MLEEFKRKIEKREAAILVAGMGYVGLPLATAFADAGFVVHGYDTDAGKIGALEAGESYLSHFPAEKFAKHVKEGWLVPVREVDESTVYDVAVLCVPTPLDDSRSPDLSHVLESAKCVGRLLRRGCLVSLESTTYPGTTSGVVRRDLEEESGLSVGDDFFLVYTPERQDPGNPTYHTHNIPKVIGGVTPACLDAGISLYKEVMEEVVPVSSTDTAEMVKLFENVYRAVNIALVNEMKMLCHGLGINVWEVIRAASTKPFGFHPFWPGPGLGGHCIPLDPFYLTWRARQIGMTTKFVELAGEINASMPEYVVDKVRDALNTQSKCINGSRVLLLGVAYKPDVSDTRESPAARIIELLEGGKAVVGYHDPYVPEFCGRESMALTANELAHVDCVVLVTDHTCVDYGMVEEHAFQA
jgi:UDP-N-acetyl-D-glucosamine dehydrogenase